MSEDEIRKLAVEIQNYEMQKSVIERRMEILLSTISELEVTEQTLENIKNEKSGQEFLAPIGSGSYVKAKLSSSDKVLMGLGADVVAEVNIEDAIGKLNERKKTFQKAVLELRGHLQQLQSKLNELRAKVQQLLEKTKNLETRRSENNV